MASAYIKDEQGNKIRFIEIFQLLKLLYHL